MVIGATRFCARLRDGIFLRAACCSLNRLSADREARVQQLRDVKGAGPLGDPWCADGVHDQPHLRAASQGDHQVADKLMEKIPNPEYDT